MYDFAVIGNGLLGSTFAYKLSQLGFSIALFDTSNNPHYFSSHNDDTRIFKLHHRSPFWRTITYESISDLQDISSFFPKIFTQCPVKYNFSVDDPAIISADVSANPDTSDPFPFLDNYGGIIHPKIYIQCLNNQLPSSTSKIYLSAAQYKTVNRTNTVYYIHGKICSKFIIDTRGFHGVLDPNLCQIIAKTYLIFKLNPNHNAPFCFIDSSFNHQDFSDYYGVYNYLNSNGENCFKSCFTENKPLFLQENTLNKWFTCDYLNNNLIYEFTDFIKNKFQISSQPNYYPCAFTSTSTGQPIINFNNNVLSISGCNGMLAKSAFGLVNRIIDQYFI